MKTKNKPKPPAESDSELAPPGAPPHVAVAPGLLAKEHTVIRASDDTDEDYEARSQLVAAVIAHARKG